LISATSEAAPLDHRVDLLHVGAISDGAGAAWRDVSAADARADGAIIESAGRRRAGSARIGTRVPLRANSWALRFRVACAASAGANMKG
jgi:hypothetical protein